MALAVGARLGPFEILAAIGAGGMGEVYKARDTRLDRVVAIKVAQEKFSDRFAREARAVAALNHPNIRQLHDVGPDYLVMEFVEGAPISAPDTSRKLVDLAVQIADGLAAAHTAGILHRDLKPENILVTPQGRVKILDFGLAKAAVAGKAAAVDDSTRTIPVSDGLTDPGTTVGTPAYMSPEQARGMVDLSAQSDQFSLGVVLYEIAAGKHPFRRESRAETMTAIIREDPEPLPATVPAPFRWVIERLLSKDAGDRYDSTRDLYREIRQIRERFSQQATSGAQPVQTANPPKRRRAMRAAVLPATAVVSALVTFALVPNSQTDLSSLKFTPIAREEATEMAPDWSPDGKSLTYNVTVHGVWQVFVKTVGGSEATQITHSQQDCLTPFWSPDGTTIYCDSSAGMWAVPASGGSPLLVLPEARLPALRPDGNTVVFSRGGKDWVGAINSREARLFWQAPDGLVSWRKFSPDGSKLAVIDNYQLWVVQYPSGKARKLGIVSKNGASWFADGRHLLVGDDMVGTALAIVDANTGSRRVIYRGTDLTAFPAVSPDGKKVMYSVGSQESNVLEISLAGHIRTEIAGTGQAYLPDWAPSGTHYLVTRTGTNGFVNFVLEDRSTSDGFARIVEQGPPGTIGAGAGRWAPDGSRFMFLDGTRNERGGLSVANASGAGVARVAEITMDALAAHAWSPDGQWIAFVRREGSTQHLIKIRPVVASHPEVLANAAPALASSYEVIQWSPRGDWILYSNGQGMWLISPNGSKLRKLTGQRFLSYNFSRDGVRAYGIVRNTTGEGAEWQLYSTDVDTGKDRVLTALDFPASTSGVAGFSLHPDGSRFLTSIAKVPMDIWMLEGFDQHKSWLDRLLHR